VISDWPATKVLLMIDMFVYVAGIPIKTTMDNTTTVQYAGLISQLSDKARSVVRDLDPSNDLTFLRIRSKKHEIMVAPGQYLTIPVVIRIAGWLKFAMLPICFINFILYASKCLDSIIC
jgi:dynein light chain roadblock-type